MPDKKCANCKWFQKDENFKEDYICGNKDSEYEADWVVAEHSCEAWEKGDDESVVLQRLESRIS